MDRSAWSIALILVLLPVVRADDEAKLKKRLDHPVRLEKGIDANTALADAVNYLAEHHEVPIFIDQQAFTRKRIEQVSERPIALRPLVGVRLELALQLLARQVDGTLEIRKGGVWIVPETKPVDLADLARPASDVIKERMKLEIDLKNGIDANTPLLDALEYVSDRYVIQIIIDRKAFERANIMAIEEHGTNHAPATNLLLGQALENVLKPVKAGYVLRENFVLVVPLKK